MKNKIRILAALLALQFIVIGLVYWPAGKDKKSEPLLPNLSARQLKGLTISDREGKKLVLEKQGDSWNITAPAPFLPADSDKITALLTKLSALSTERLVAASAGAHQRLEVTDGLFQRKIELVFDKAEKKTILIGTQPGFQLAHIRVAGTEQVYLGRGIASWDIATDSRLWWRERYPGQKAGTIAAIALSNGHGSFSVRKQGEQWLDDASTAKTATSREPLDSDRMQQLLRATDLRVEEYLGRERKKGYGLDRPAAVLKMTRTTANGKPEEITVELGKVSGGKGRYVAKASNSPYYVALRAATVEPLLDATPAKLRAAGVKSQVAR